MSLLTSNEQNLELKKHVNAIHCTNYFSLVQRKLFNALLFNAYPDLPYKSQYEIPTRQLCNLIGYNSNDYGKLKQALVALITTAIEWNIIDYSSSQSSGEWRASSALSAAKLEGGICTYEYSSLMKELLFRPEIYGKLNMVVLSKFKSSYGLALYENCMRYQGLPQTPWFPLDIFRKLMGVVGDKYIAFKDFKKRVLNIAVNEVNLYSVLQIIPEIKRTNHKVISLRFKLQNVAVNSDDLSISKKPEIEDINGSLIDTLSKDFSLSPEAINDLFNKYDSSFIQEKINLIINSESYKSGKIKGRGGYLISALKNNYQPIKTEVTNNKNRDIEIGKHQRSKHLSQVDIEEKYKQYVRNTMTSYLKALSDTELKKLVAEFEQDMRANQFELYDKYSSEGLENPLAKAYYVDFIKRTKSSDMGEIVSLEKFITKIKCLNS